MIQMYGRSSVLLWHCLEGTVLGFHCKAPYFPIKSQQLRKTLLVCSSLSIRNQTTNYKNPSFGSRSKNDIFNSHISSRRSENKYFKTWLRLAIGSWHSHGLVIWMSGRRVAENKFTCWYLSCGRKAKDGDRSKAPLENLDHWICFEGDTHLG